MRIECQKHRLDVHHADLSGSRFDDVNLSGLDFHNVNMSGCSFDDVNMSGWRVHNVNLAGLKIDKANLAGAYDCRRAARWRNDRGDCCHGPARLLARRPWGE